MVSPDNGMLFSQLQIKISLQARTPMVSPQDLLADQKNKIRQKINLSEFVYFFKQNQFYDGEHQTSLSPLLLA